MYLSFIYPLSQNSSAVCFQMVKGVSTPEEIRWLIIHHLYNGMTESYTATAVAVSIKTVRRIKTCFAECKDVYPDRSNHMKRQQKLTRTHQEALKAMLVENPTMYLDEIQLTMALKYRVSVHISTVCRTLARMNITHKKVSIDLYLRLAIDPSTSLPCWHCYDNQDCDAHCDTHPDPSLSTSI